MIGKKKVICKIFNHFYYIIILLLNLSNVKQMY
jgi:hypothetical protein